MNDDRPVAPGQNDLEPVDTDQIGNAQGDLVGIGPDAAASSMTGARPPSPSASRTQSRITVAALLTFAAAVVLLVVSIVQHG